MALQAIYEWQMSGNEVYQIIAQFMDEQKKKVDIEYFSQLVNGVTGHAEELDELYQPHLANRGVEKIDQVDRAILRIACYELKNRKDVSYRIVLNEAIELAKAYASSDSHKFVNGVLDKVAKQLGA